MRFRTPKRAKLDRQAQKTRDEYDRMFPFCQICGEVATDTHEIARGRNRLKAQSERCCLLHLCRGCHDEVGDPAAWPISRQLALKKKVDPMGYDLQRFNEIMGRKK